MTPAEPHEGLASKQVNMDDRSLAIPLAKKNCIYGTGFLFCQNPGEEEDGEDEESQYLSDLEQLWLEWFGDY